MFKRKFLAAMLAAAVMVTTVTDTVVPAGVAEAAETTPVETTIKRTKVSNPILSSYPDDPDNEKVSEELRGTVLYGGDPSVMVEDDTVYLYTGRDIPIDLLQVKGGTKVEDGYYMFEWQCYKSTDLKNWTYEGVIMSADKQSMTWASSGTDAWAGQITNHYDPEMQKKYYYFYNCTWDATSEGKQSIGVAVADTPTGWSTLAAKKEYCEAKGIKTSIPDDDPKSLYFVDLGKPLVKGTVTTGETSGWNDIDPTVWVEEDENDVEHRYLSWGNGKVFVCELNEDMISILDVNGDRKTTFGTQANGKTSEDVDIIELDVAGLNFTEAPWIYRRKDAQGNPTGPYYLFYAYSWREQMAYATTENLMDGKLEFGKVLMPPTATSNTNHMAVFDFEGKTYFVYHNGSVRGGSGFRRTACITEMYFNEDGSIQEIPETAIGITGDTPYYLYSNTGAVISHENYVNSSADSDYPYMKVKVGTYYKPEKLDASWAIVDGKADPTKESYVSIQSENKPGLYMTVNDDNTVTLAHDWNYSDGFIKDGYTKPNGTPSEITTFDVAMGKAQTFRTVKGLTDSQNAVSFESVAKEGYYLSVDNDGSLIVKELKDCDAKADFYLNNPPAATTNPGNKNDITSLKADGTTLKKSGYTYNYKVPSDTKSVTLSITAQDAKGFITVDGKQMYTPCDVVVPLKGIYTEVAIEVYSEDKRPRVNYAVVIEKEFEANPISDPVKSFSFEEKDDGAVAVQKNGSTTNPDVEEITADLQYKDGVNGGKAVYLNGTYGLKLWDVEEMSEDYTISYWMKPEVLGTNVDPTLTAGTFSPQYWLNLTFGRTIWSYNTGFVENTGTISYKQNEWQLVVLAVEGGKAKLYVDGELKENGKIATDILGKDGAAVYFGVNAWDAYFKGSLDELKIFDGALDEGQVMAYMATFLEKPKEPVQPNPKDPVNVGAFGDGEEVILPGEKEETTDQGGSNQGGSDPVQQNPTGKVTNVTVKVANQKPGTKTVYLKKGGKVTLSETVTGTGTFSKEVTWSSSKMSVATVDKGVVKAKAAGTAKITVASKEDATKKATITVTVSKKQVKNKVLKLKATKKSLKKGKTYTVAIKSITKKTTDAVTYKSSKSGVASVDKFGVVTAKKKGNATITVKCGKKSAKLKITVKN